MLSISEILRSFDRKERAWLVRNAIGSMSPSLAPAFLETVHDELKLNSPIPVDAWWGMDYHLDWLAAAVHVFRLNAFSHGVSLWPEKNEELLNQNIQDIDFIIADAERVILIEAKAFGSWDREQLKKKLARLHRLLDKDNLIYDLQRHRSIQIYFMLMSRERPPAKEACEDWPSWAVRDGAPLWIEMKTSLEGRVNKTVRCNEQGKECNTGRYWKIKVETI